MLLKYCLLGLFLWRNCSSCAHTARGGWESPSAPAHVSHSWGLSLFVLNEPTPRISNPLNLPFRNRHGLFQKSSEGKTKQVSPLFNRPSLLTKTFVLRWHLANYPPLPSKTSQSHPAPSFIVLPSTAKPILDKYTDLNRNKSNITKCCYHFILCSNVW